MRTKILENGITIIVHHDHRLKHTTLNLMYKIGSANEKKSNTGLAHFFEHMMFEGSRKFPDFDEELQLIQAENNAFTTQDYTCYYETFPSEHLNDILNIEKDRLVNLKLSKSKVILQKKVITEEFKETSIQPPLADFWHYLLKMCFNNSYQWPVIGAKISHIENYKLENIKKFYSDCYSTESLIISVASNLHENDVIDNIELKFSSINKSSKTRPLKINKISKTFGNKTLLRRNISSPHFFLAFHIDDFGTKKYFISDMISDLLTNGESSILYHSLIIKNKFCTEINSYTTENKSCNLLIIEGKVNNNVNVELVINQIKIELDKLKLKEINQKKFETIYNKAITYWSFYHYNTEQLVQNMALFFYTQKKSNPIEYINKIYSLITKNDIMNEIKAIINFKKSSMLIYLPKKK